MSKEYICEGPRLTAFCADLFHGFGFREEDSYAIADQLVDTDMRGMRSHGVVRVEMYLTHARKGAIDPKAMPTILKETPTTAVIDGNKAAAAPACEIAVKLAREKARQCGFGMVVVRNSNHFGAAGHWALKMCQDDMIGFVAANTPPLMAAPTSKTAVIGNNPFCVVVPAEGESMCLDISNGVMAFGKIHEYRRLNKPFPENAWLDENGRPTTDPFANDFLKFISLPIAMHKGFGLAVMVEAVTSMLAGGAVAAECAPPGADLEANNPTSFCFLAIDIENFCPPEEYRTTVSNFIQYLHSVETREGAGPIFYPGEIENTALKKSIADGVAIPDTVKDFLVSKAQEIGLEVPKGLFQEMER